jgi:hypothetical protein
MRKFKVAVNLILGFPIILAAVNPVAAGSKETKKSFLLVALKDSEYTIRMQSDQPPLAPVGSLLKPFAALYLLEHGIDRQQVVFCPRRSRSAAGASCWTTAGHGGMDLRRAMIQSCNFYFRSVFSGLDFRNYTDWLVVQFGWPDDLRITTADQAYGDNLPRALEASSIIKMYARLLQKGKNHDQSARFVIEALQQTCEGTLHAFCDGIAQVPAYHFILGKTGTVLESGRTLGVVLLHLLHRPTGERLLLLCYKRGLMGADVAVDALEVLKKYDAHAKNRSRHDR